jgi:hypothetical protein
MEPQLEPAQVSISKWEKHISIFAEKSPKQKN